MSTQKTDTQTGQFDPGSMQAFQGLTGAWAPLAQQWMNNPFSNPQFGLEQQMGTRQAQNLGGTSMSNLLQNMTASGMQGGASSPAGLEMQQNQARANTGLQAQLGFMNPTMNALQRQQYAMGLGSQYRPLQTGQKNVESTSGLGTWLPQLLNLGMGAASMAMGMPSSGSGAGNAVLGSNAGNLGSIIGGQGFAGANPSMPQWGPGLGGSSFGPPQQAPQPGGGSSWNPWIT